MNTPETSAIRNLTADEQEQVCGAVKVVIGPVKVKIMEDGLIFSLAIEHVGSFNVDEDGVWIGL